MKWWIEVVDGYSSWDCGISCSFSAKSVWQLLNARSNQSRCPFDQTIQQVCSFLASFLGNSSTGCFSFSFFCKSNNETLSVHTRLLTTEKAAANYDNTGLTWTAFQRTCNEWVKPRYQPIFCALSSFRRLAHFSGQMPRDGGRTIPPAAGGKQYEITVHKIILFEINRFLSKFNTQ